MASPVVFPAADGDCLFTLVAVPSPSLALHLLTEHNAAKDSIWQKI